MKFYKNRGFLILLLSIIVFSSNSQNLYKADSLWVSLRQVKLANQAMVELKFTKQVDKLQQQELIAKRLETNSLRWEVQKLKENDSLCNKKTLLQDRRQFLDSNRILELSQMYKQEKNGKTLSLVVGIPVSCAVGILAGILLKSFLIK